MLAAFLLVHGRVGQRQEIGDGQRVFVVAPDHANAHAELVGTMPGRIEGVEILLQPVVEREHAHFRARGEDGEFVSAGRAMMSDSR